MFLLLTLQTTNHMTVVENIQRNITANNILRQLLIELEPFLQSLKHSTNSKQAGNALSLFFIYPCNLALSCSGLSPFFRLVGNSYMWINRNTSLFEAYSFWKIKFASIIQQQCSDDAQRVLFYMFRGNALGFMSTCFWLGFHYYPCLLLLGCKQD